MRLEIARNIISFLVGILIILGMLLILLRVLIFAEVLQPAREFDLGYAKHVGLIMVHIVPSFVFIIFGPLQFISKIRRDYPIFHKWSGRLYIVSAIIISISALILSFVNGVAGLSGTASIVFFSPLFLTFLGIAFYRIRQHKFSSHREWMIRAFSLGLAVITTRPLFGILEFILNSHTEQEILGIAFWLAFSFHLVFVEIWINITRVRSS